MDILIIILLIIYALIVVPPLMIEAIKGVIEFYKDLFK